MPTIRVLRQRDWNEDELQAVGFHHYDTRKRLVMAKVIVETRNVEVTLETLIAGRGDVLCYEPSHIVRAGLEDYDHWPVRRDLFIQTYRPWDEPGWRPNEVEAHLMRFGCRPYYKASGVWAQRLTRPIYVQTLESQHPILVPVGRWLIIGVQGEPYTMGDTKFRSRYQVEVQQV